MITVNTFFLVFCVICTPSPFMACHLIHHRVWHHISATNCPAYRVTPCDVCWFFLESIPCGTNSPDIASKLIIRPLHVVIQCNRQNCSCYWFQDECFFFLFSRLLTVRCSVRPMRVNLDFHYSIIKVLCRYTSLPFVFSEMRYWVLSYVYLGIRTQYIQLVCVLRKYSDFIRRYYLQFLFYYAHYLIHGHCFFNNVCWCPVNCVRPKRYLQFFTRQLFKIYMWVSVYLSVDYR